MLSVHIMSEKFENADQFGFAFEKPSGREIAGLLWGHRFRKTPFSKCFSFTLKRKAGVFKLLRFEERLRKAPSFEMN